MTLFTRLLDRFRRPKYNLSRIHATLAANPWMFSPETAARVLFILEARVKARQPAPIRKRGDIYYLDPLDLIDPKEKS